MSMSQIRHAAKFPTPPKSERGPYPRPAFKIKTSAGGLGAAPAPVLARQFMTHNDLLSGVGDGAALEEAQLLTYAWGCSQERIERGSQSPRATSKPAANGLPMPYAVHCESAW